MLGVAFEGLFESIFFCWKVDILVDEALQILHYLFNKTMGSFKPNSLDQNNALIILQFFKRLLHVGKKLDSTFFLIALGCENLIYIKSLEGFLV